MIKFFIRLVMDISKSGDGFAVYKPSENTPEPVAKSFTESESRTIMVNDNGVVKPEKVYGSGLDVWWRKTGDKG